MSTQPRKSAFAALKSTINIVNPEVAQTREAADEQGREAQETSPVQAQREQAMRHVPAKAKTTRRGDPNYQQINTYVPKEVHRAVKIELVKDNDREMSELIEELLAAWLKKKGITIAGKNA
jgi:hypothetical protein